MLIGIFGTGRNGSTLINRVLDGIPGTYVHPVEMNYLAVWNDLAANHAVRRRTIVNASVEPLNHLSRRVSVAELESYYSYQLKEIEDTCFARAEGEISKGDDVWQTLRKRQDYTVTDFVPTYLQAMSRWSTPAAKNEHFLFKTIEVPYIQDYERLFPDMKFVHIVRNPLDTYSSLKRSLMCYKGFPSWYLNGDILKTLIDRRWIPHSRTITQQSLSANHYIVRYEDILKDPLKAVSGICQWLKVPLPEHPTKQTVLGGRLMKTVPDVSSHKGAVTPADVTSNLKQQFSYDEVLTDREKDLIILKTRPYAERLGYAFPKIDSVKLGISWILPDKWEFMHNKTILDYVKSTSSYVQRRWDVLRGLSSR